MQKQSIVKAIGKGIDSANKTYEKWSNGLWLSDAGIENLLSVKVAEAIVKDKGILNLNKGEFIRLETTFREIEKHSNARKKPGPKLDILNLSQRSDITLWHKNQTIAAIIEIKRFWNKRTCGIDLDRLGAIISNYGRQRSGTVKFGILAVFVAEKKDHTVYNKYKDIKKYCDDLNMPDIDISIDELPTSILGTPGDLRNPDNHWWAAWAYGGVIITLTAKANH